VDPRGTRTGGKTRGDRSGPQGHRDPTCFRAGAGTGTAGIAITVPVPGMLDREDQCQCASASFKPNYFF
jgi:hypothetical protein